MLRLLQRATLVGLGGYICALVLLALFAPRHPGAYVHFSPLEGFGISAALKVASFVSITVGAAVGRLLVRGRFAQLPVAWLLSSGAFVVLAARALPALPTIALERCPSDEVCNPYDWSVPLEWFREPLLALAVTVIISLIASKNSGAPPNTSLERTRER